MPYDKRKSDNGKWEVINSDSGDIKGTHDTEEEANDQLAALYANSNPDEETIQKMNLFIPITKINAERREVWGWGAIEEPDNSDEILDYSSSKPNFIDWSQKAQKRSGGKSLGNVRAMHQNIAAGKLIELKADDVHKGFYVGAKIVDDNEWKKVEAGVYTGFSVGGSYEKRWSDFQNPGKIRYTARPTELSIVDSPCIPSATFEMVKADGRLVKRKFKPGEGKNMIAVVTEPRMIKVDRPSRMVKVDWAEDKHPRADDGKFTSGGGGGGGKHEPDIRSEGAESFHSPAPKRTPKEPDVRSEGADTYSYPKGSQRPGFRTQTGYGGHSSETKAQRREREKDWAAADRANAAYAGGSNKHGDAPEMRARPDAARADQLRDMMASADKPADSNPVNFEEGHQVKISGRVAGSGKIGTISQIAPSGHFFGVQDKKGNHLGYFHESDLESNDDEWDEEDEEEDDVLKGDDMPKEILDDEEFVEDEIPEEELEKEEEDLPIDEEDEYEDIDKADDEELLDEEFEDLDETAPAASTEEVMKIVQSALVDIGDLLMAAERVLAKKNGKVPEAPEPIADIPLPGKLKDGSFTAEQMPPPSVLLELNPNSVPSQQVLAEHAVMSKDLTDAFNAWMPQIGAMVKTVVAEEVHKAVAGLLPNTHSAPVQISQVSPRIIKVRKENTQ